MKLYSSHITNPVMAQGVTMTKLTGVGLGLFLLTFLLAPNRAEAGSKGFHISLTGMALTSSTSQGGQGPQGSTILTHADLFYNFSFWGIGMYMQYDIQGTSQTDTAIGPKAELHLGPFYFELGYAAMMSRAFTDRSIAKQGGSGWLMGLGVRFSGGKGRRGRGGGWFFQATYKYRQQFISNQDGSPLSEPIFQIDGYPVFGFGYRF